MGSEKKIGGSSNGRTWAFEAQYLGSIPSPPDRTSLSYLNHREFKRQLRKRADSYKVKGVEELK